jgi:hypothetical protein
LLFLEHHRFSVSRQHAPAAARSRGETVHVVEESRQGNMGNQNIKRVTETEGFTSVVDRQS